MLFFAISCPGSGDDRFLDAYLRPIVDRVHRDRPQTIFLCGGRGNRVEDAVPQRMFDWFIRYAPNIVDRLRIIGYVHDACGLVRAVSRHLRILRVSTAVRVAFFCESSHAREVQEYLRITLRIPEYWNVVPIPVSMTA